MFNNLKLRNKIILPVRAMLLVLMSVIVVFVTITVTNLTGGNLTADRVGGSTGTANSRFADTENHRLLIAKSVDGNYIFFH